MKYVAWKMTISISFLSHWTFLFFCSNYIFLFLEQDKFQLAGPLIVSLSLSNDNCIQMQWSLTNWILMFNVFRTSVLNVGRWHPWLKADRRIGCQCNTYCGFKNILWYLIYFCTTDEDFKLGTLFCISLFCYF